MHQTTVRFSPDLWAVLEDEAVRMGVSIAQYLREAAIARVAFTDATRGDSPYVAALEEAMSAHAAFARSDAEYEADSARAVLAQSQIARERSRQLRIASESARERHVRVRADVGRKLRAERATPGKESDADVRTAGSR